MLSERDIKRVHAMRLRGQWTASADDGVRIGNGAGYSWHEAVSAAIRDLNEQTQKEEPCGTA